MALVDSLLRGAVVEVRSAIAPPLRLELASLTDGSPPSLLVRVLKPEVVVRSGATVVYQAAPAGSPGESTWMLVAAVAVALVVVALLLVRSL